MRGGWGRHGGRFESFFGCCLGWWSQGTVSSVPPGWLGVMEDQDTSRQPRLIAALVAAHAALDTATVPGPDGAPAGWVPAETLSAAELGRAVRLQAGLEGRLSGLRLHTLAAAETTGASQVTGAADTGAWAASAAGRSRPRSWGAAWLGTLLAEKYPH